MNRVAPSCSPRSATTDEAGRITQVEVAVEPTHQQWLCVATFGYDEAGNLVVRDGASRVTWRIARPRHGDRVGLRPR